MMEDRADALKKQIAYLKAEMLEFQKVAEDSTTSSTLRAELQMRICFDVSRIVHLEAKLDELCRNKDIDKV